MLCRSSWARPCVVCADLAVNAKQSMEHRWPGVFRGRLLRRYASDRLEIARAELLDRVRQRRRVVLLSPAFLVVQNDPVESRPTDPDDRGSAGLTFQCDQAECFLHSWMNKQIRGTIVAGQFQRVGTVIDPVHALC